SGGADAGREQLRQIQRQPAVERRSAYAHDEAADQEAGAVVRVALIEQEQRGHRRNAEQRVGNPPSESIAEQGGADRAEYGAKRSADLGVLFGIGGRFGEFFYL